MMWKNAMIVIVQISGPIMDESMTSCQDVIPASNIFWVARDAVLRGKQKTERIQRKHLGSGGIVEFLISRRLNA